MAREIQMFKINLKILIAVCLPMVLLNCVGTANLPSSDTDNTALLERIAELESRLTDSSPANKNTIPQLGENSEGGASGESFDYTALRQELDLLKSQITNTKGEKGDSGNDGTNGVDGLNGQDGRDGADGRDGTDGQSIKGDTGAKGDQGLSIKGDKGDKGDTGNDGADGEDGEDGEKGDKGDTGDKGDSGNDGADGEDGEDGQDGSSGQADLTSICEYNPFYIECGSSFKISSSAMIDRCYDGILKKDSEEYLLCERVPAKLVTCMKNPLDVTACEETSDILSKSNHNLQSIKQKAVDFCTKTTNSHYSRKAVCSSVLESISSVLHDMEGDTILIGGDGTLSVATFQTYCSFESNIFKTNCIGEIYSLKLLGAYDARISYCIENGSRNEYCSEFLEVKPTDLEDIEVFDSDIRSSRYFSGRHHNNVYVYANGEPDTGFVNIKRIDQTEGGCAGTRSDGSCYTYKTVYYPTLPELDGKTVKVTSSTNSNNGFVFWTGTREQRSTQIYNSQTRRYETIPAHTVKRAVVGLFPTTELGQPLPTTTTTAVWSGKHYLSGYETELETPIGLPISITIDFGSRQLSSGDTTTFGDDNLLSISGNISNTGEISGQFDITNSSNSNLDIKTHNGSMKGLLGSEGAIGMLSSSGANPIVGGFIVKPPTILPGQ